MLLELLLKQLMKKGTLNVIDHRGKLKTFGNNQGPSVTIRLHNRSVSRKIALNPRLAVGEAYMDGSLTVEDGGSIYDFLDLTGSNLHVLDELTIVRIRNWLSGWTRPLQQHNPLGVARKNVAHHYDLSDDLFDLFLDSDRQYSCGYFDSQNSTLEQAQKAKKRHLASKLILDKPGLKTLDIGSGWGGLGIYLHQETGANVTGLTLSKEQQKYAEKRTQDLQIQGDVRFLLQDYRRETNLYDRIVSVGMFEHVGIKHYGEFFNKVGSLLKDDGVAVIHTIARWDGPSVTNPWLRKYIFPGGYCPSMSEIFSAIEKTGLKVLDTEMLRLHYADTLRHWSRNFAYNRNKIKEIYDERFCKMWEFYLAGSEIAFRRQDHMIAQLQIAWDQEAAPLTRDYMVEWEKNHQI
tara:strand:+ start:42769 stop:43983 length:1215 start_codon:yes stop_codon:yes gene_type:complete